MLEPHSVGEGMVSTIQSNSLNSVNVLDDFKCYKCMLGRCIHIKRSSDSDTDNRFVNHADNHYVLMSWL